METRKTITKWRVSKNIADDCQLEIDWGRDTDYKWEKKKCLEGYYGLEFQRAEVEQKKKVQLNLQVVRCRGILIFWM